MHGFDQSALGRGVGRRSPLHQASKASGLSIGSLLETGGHDGALSVPAGVRCPVYFRDVDGSSFLSALTYRTPASLINSWSKRPFSMALRTSGTNLSGT